MAAWAVASMGYCFRVWGFRVKGFRGLGYRGLGFRVSGSHSDGGESSGKLAPCPCPYPHVLAGRCSSASKSGDIRCFRFCGRPCCLCWATGKAMRGGGLTPGPKVRSSFLPCFAAIFSLFVEAFATALFAATLSVVCAQCSGGASSHSSERRPAHPDLALNPPVPHEPPQAHVSLICLGTQVSGG